MIHQGWLSFVCVSNRPKCGTVPKQSLRDDQIRGASKHQRTLGSCTYVPGSACADLIFLTHDGETRLVLFTYIKSIRRTNAVSFSTCDSPLHISRQFFSRLTLSSY